MTRAVLWDSSAILALLDADDADHARAVAVARQLASEERPSFIVGRLGARLGNQTSYQFCEANLDLGTPRGGRRTVPMRKPSLAFRGEPSLTIVIAMVALLRHLRA